MACQAFLIRTFVLLLALLSAVAVSAGEEAHMTEAIKWLGHDAFRLEGQVVVYTDPFQLDGEQVEADLVLITHSHFDHCSPDDVAKVQGPDTVIITTSDCASKLSGDVRTVKPGDSLEVKGVKVEAVRAYNTNKKFHPRENDWVGYVITFEGIRIYHAGDTDRIPEMREIDCQIALLPVSGTYVMTAEGVVGTIEDAKRFAAALSDLSDPSDKIKTEILPKAKARPGQ